MYIVMIGGERRVYGADEYRKAVIAGDTVGEFLGELVAK